MGHAGAIIAGGKGDAKSKIETLEKHGIFVTNNPSKLGESMLKVMKERMCSAEGGQVLKFRTLSGHPG